MKFIKKDKSTKDKKAKYDFGGLQRKALNPTDGKSKSNKYLLLAYAFNY